MDRSADGSHLDLLALDALRAGGGAPEERSHLEACEACRGALKDLEKLAAEIKALPGRSVEVPRERDLAILSMAGEALARSRRPKVLRLRIAVSAAAALLLVASLGFWLSTRSPAPEGARGGPLASDRGRRLDIVDAYNLTLRIRSGAPIESAWDLNGDGVVDSRDVDEIARKSVSLSRRMQ